jgi:hypothetical protein
MAYRYNPLLPLGLDLSGTSTGFLKADGTETATGTLSFTSEFGIDTVNTMGTDVLNIGTGWADVINIGVPSRYVAMHSSVNYGTATGTDTYAVTLNGNFTTYFDGTKYLVKFTNANTSTCTLNINTLGAKDLVKQGGATLVAGDLIADHIYEVVYNGTTDSFYVLGVTGEAFTTVKVSISSAEILAMGVTPVQLLPAPGAGKTYLIGEVIVRYNAVTTAYATNTTLRVIYAGATVPIATNGVLLTSTVTRVGYLAPSPTTGTSNIHYAVNAALQATVQTGNPTAGDGTIDIYITYKTITL